MRLVTLISNDPSGGEKNTLSCFRNVFDPPICLKPRVNYSIALQSIGFDYNALGNLTHCPCLIRVKLKQLYAQVDGEKSCDTILHQFSLENNLSANNKFVHHSPEVKTFISLKQGSSLSELTVVLEDENEEQLNLGQGQPTFIVLELSSTMDHVDRDVVWHLSSLDECVYKRTNSANSFKISFPHDLARDIDHSRWEVALSSCILPAQLKIDDSLKVNDLWIRMTSVNYGINRIGVIQIGEAVNQGSIPTSTSTLLEKLCAEANRLNEERGNMLVRMSVETDNEGKKLVMESEGDLIVRIPTQLSSILFNENKPQSFHFSKRFEKRVVDYNFDMLRPHSVVIYCSAIAPQIYGGGKMKKVLAHVPILLGRDEKTQHYEYQPRHLQFIPLSTLLTDTIQFELHSVSGEMIRFENEHLGTYLTLILQKKRKKRKGRW